jgi:hypothetical protein
MKTIKLKELVKVSDFQIKVGVLYAIESVSYNVVTLVGDDYTIGKITLAELSQAGVAGQYHPLKKEMALPDAFMINNIEPTLRIFRWDDDIDCYKVL